MAILTEPTKLYPKNHRVVVTLQTLTNLIIQDLTVAKNYILFILHLLSSEFQTFLVMPLQYKTCYTKYVRTYE
jgi:hypothetical protein